jgi:hypothetical protein
MVQEEHKRQMAEYATAYWRTCCEIVIWQYDLVI